MHSRIRKESGARAPDRVRMFAARPGFLRRAYGPGWALVGDSGYFKDPITSHGLTDALRDAELLARVAGPDASQDPKDPARPLMAMLRAFSKGETATLS